MLKMYFDYRDVFRAVRLGLSPKKMWVMFWGLTCGLVIYGVFGYLAHLASGKSLAETWTIFGLLPAAPWPGAGLWPWLLWTLGVAGGLLAYILFSSAVARLAAEQLKGNEFFEVKGAFGHIGRHWKSILGGTAVIGSFLILIVFGGVLLGWWGRIPVLGELGVALLALPAFLVCLFAIFLMVSLAVGLFFSPVISGATQGDSFDNLFEVFSSITSQPWRLVVYTGLLKLLAGAATMILASFAIAALGFAYQVLAGSMGGKFAELAIAAFNLYTPPLALNCLAGAAAQCPWAAGLPSGLLATPELNWSGQLSAFLLGMSLNVVRLLVLSYGLSVFVTGQTIIYGIIVMKRDQRNIFETKDDEACPAPEEKAVIQAETEEAPKAKPGKAVRKRKAPAKSK